MSNVKSKSNSKNKTIKNKNNNLVANHKSEANDIPINQKHQIISVKEFGDYNYDTRRAQWHKKAGHNKHKEQCEICGNSDNWATIEVNNGAHICYFCWVKKPTEEVKKIIASAKKKTTKTIKNAILNLNFLNKNNKTPNYSDVVEITKFYDDKGVSFRNTDEIQNYRTNKNTIDKTSRYGISPSVFYDPSTDYRQPFTQIRVVRPYENDYLVKTARAIKIYADKQAKDAINEYNNEVTKAKLITKANMINAKVNSMRILTKAILLEKNEIEQKNEALRHAEAIENIKLLREAKLEKNKVDLANNINNVNLCYDKELKNNEDNLIKSKIRLEKQALINELKIKQHKDKIKTLSQGEDYKRTSIAREINQIRFAKSIPNQINLASDDDSIAKLVARFEAIDPSKLSPEEREVVVKFLRLVDSYNKEEKYKELSIQYKSAINDLDKSMWNIMKKSKKNKNQNEYMIVSYDTYKKIINAKKETLCISMPVNKLQVEVKTKTIKIKKPSNALKPITTNQSLVKIKPQKMNFEKMDFQKADFLDNFYARDIERTINKFKRIVRNTLGSNGFTITPYGNNAYKINYQKMGFTKYQLKYKKDWRDWFNFKNKQPARFNSDVDYVSLEEFNKQNQNWFSSLFQQKLNDHGEPVPKKLNKLRRLIESLPSDPVIMQNNGLFEQERVSLSRAIKNLRDLDVNYNWSQSQVDKTLREVNEVLDLYSQIASADRRYYHNIHRAQIEDEKLMHRMKVYERNIVNGHANAEYVYNQRKNRINERFATNMENAQNQSLLNIEYIYQQEQNNLNKEDQQHLWNQASLYEMNNKMANNQHKFENSLINTTINEINKFTKKTNIPFDLSILPAKIAKQPITSNETLYLTFNKINNNVIVQSESNQSKKISSAKAINKEIPENVDKILVLDKYRNVDDLKTRVALLTEYAKTSYEQAMVFNKQREEKEIAAAYAILEKKLETYDEIYFDAKEIKYAGDRLNHLVQERKWVQNNYDNLKAEKWKVYDKDQMYKAKIERLKQKQEHNQLMLIQKQQNRYDRQRNRILKKKEKYLDYHEIVK